MDDQTDRELGTRIRVKMIDGSVKEATVDPDLESVKDLKHKVSAMNVGLPRRDGQPYHQSQVRLQGEDDG